MDIHGYPRISRVTVFQQLLKRGVYTCQHLITSTVAVPPPAPLAVPPPAPLAVALSKDRNARRKLPLPHDSTCKACGYVWKKDSIRRTASQSASVKPFAHSARSTIGRARRVCLESQNDGRKVCKCRAVCRVVRCAHSHTAHRRACGRGQWPASSLTVVLSSAIRAPPPVTGHCTQAMHSTDVTTVHGG
eukprot:5438951-Prymnesium_polylepis.1